jgi:hypothetical protein
VEQARAAGVLEGALTADLVDQFVASNGGSPSKALISQHPKAFAFVVKQFSWVSRTALAQANSSDYWLQVHLQFEQLEGLAQGYAMVNPNASATYSALDFYLLSGSDSVDDIVTGVQYRQSSGLGSINERAYQEKCSAIIRWTGADLFSGHATWTGFDQMLRIMKEYDFRFKRVDGSPVPGSLIQFSSYPGSIWSSDDFYQIGVAGSPLNLVVWETTSSVYNTSLWQALSEKTVLTFMRVQVANRLGTSGPNWTSWFKIAHSGTYTNAWVVTDYNLFRQRRNAKSLEANTVYMVEEIPGMTHEGDMTPFVLVAGYYASFNVWYFHEIYVASGTPYMVEKFGPWFSFDGVPRNLIFAREAPKTQTLQDVQALLRFNEWQTDPLSTIPVRSPANAISSRKDLAPANVSYPISYIGPECDGAIDAKVTSASLVAAATFTAVAGPTWGGRNNLPPFDWTQTSAICSGVLHKGQPDLFQYGFSQFFATPFQ